MSMMAPCGGCRAVCETAETWGVEEMGAAADGIVVMASVDADAPGVAGEGLSVSPSAEEDAAAAKTAAAGATAMSRSWSFVALLTASLRSSDVAPCGC